MGFRAGQALTTGEANVFVGYDAGYSHTTGSYCVKIGRNSGFSGTDDSNVIAIGYQAAYNFTAGTSINIGYNSGYDHTSCHTNICIGDNTDSDSGNNAGGHTATIIGHNSKRSGETFNEGVYGNSATGVGSNKCMISVSYTHLTLPTILLV